MGSARRFRKQIDLIQVAEAAELCAKAIRDATSRSTTTHPDQLDHEARMALALMDEMDAAISALSVLRRKPWQRPGLAWRAIIDLKTAAADRALTKFDTTWARIDEARAAARLAIMTFADGLHAENEAKVMAGLNHHAPDERAFWEKHVADGTPFATWALVRRLQKPPGVKGRPKGSGYKAADLQIEPEVARLIDEGETPLKAALKLASRLSGGGTPLSKARRIRRRVGGQASGE